MCVTKFPKSVITQSPPTPHHQGTHTHTPTESNPSTKLHHLPAGRRRPSIAEILFNIKAHFSFIVKFTLILAWILISTSVTTTSGGTLRRLWGTVVLVWGGERCAPGGVQRLYSRSILCYVNVVAWVGVSSNRAEVYSVVSHWNKV